MNSHSFDCIVVGKGLIGSAAAKYLQMTLKKVAVIGPGEPPQPQEALVFASHYDQGRVQRIIGFDEVWTRLCKRSVEKYPKIIHNTGINFHHGTGCLYVSPEGKDEYLQRLPTQAQIFRTAYQFLEDGNSIGRAIPDFHFPERSFGALEPAPAGHINPLELIQAQLSLFKMGGGTSIEETVIGLDKQGDNYHLRTETGNIYTTPRVLIAAGAFSNFMHLLPRPIDLFLKSETVLLAQVNKDEANRLASLPSLLYELDTGKVEGIYAIRPLRYPDGNYYLKIGCNLHTDIVFDSLKEIQEWFREGDSDSNIDLIKDALQDIMPELKVQSYKTKRCIISRTKHRQAYIGPTDSYHLYVAAGGNGYSAMCSDALGEVAASITLNGTTPEEFSLESFLPVFRW